MYTAVNAPVYLAPFDCVSVGIYKKKKIESRVSDWSFAKNLLCPGPVGPERCEGCRAGQQWPVMPGFMPQHPLRLRLLLGVAEEEWLQAKHPTEREGIGSEAHMRGPPGAAFRTSEHHSPAGSAAGRSAPVAPVGGGWRGVREPGTDGYSRQPGPSSGNTRSLMSLIVC